MYILNIENIYITLFKQKKYIPNITKTTITKTYTVVSYTTKTAITSNTIKFTAFSNTVTFYAFEIFIIQT